MPELDIAEVARRARLPTSTLRYYEQRGLIAPIGRKGLRRQYAPSVLDTLALIALGRVAGFSLEDIASLLADGGGARLDRQRLNDQARALERRITRLSAVRDGLYHAAACSAPSHLECPKFRRLMRAAARSPV